MLAVPDEHYWLSASTLAGQHTITRQAMSERLSRLIAAGQLQPDVHFKGDGKARRFHAATVAALITRQRDPSQDLRNQGHERRRRMARHAPPTAASLFDSSGSVAPSRPDDAPGGGGSPGAPLAPPLETEGSVGAKPEAATPPAPLAEPSAFEAAKTRAAIVQAEKAEFELRARQGEFVPAADVAAAAQKVAETFQQQLAGLNAIAAELYAAGRTGGEDAVHALLKEKTGAALLAVARAMSEMAEA